jgi:hypothetical protein
MRALPTARPLQRFDKKELVRRIRSLERDLDAERQRRSALAYDQQTLLAKMIRLETEDGSSESRAIPARVMTEQPLVIVCD